jgi:dTDP-4-dehydrorhamnose reductase
LKTILRLATERDELRVVSDQYGCPTSTADIAEAIIRVVQALAAKKDLDRTYHFASPGRISWHEFACEIVKRQSLFTGRTPSVTAIATHEYPTAARRPMNSELDSAKFTSTFGYRAKPWRERVAETVETLLAPARQSRTMP